MLPDGWIRRAARVGREVLALLLAADCPGCGALGTLLCDDCASLLVAQPREVRTPAGLTVVAALGFEGAPARCIRRLKEDGQTLLSAPLGKALGAALARADARAVPVPVPTHPQAFRRRGYRVPELLLRAAGRRPRRLLTTRGKHLDQRGLGRAERTRNVRGSMRVPAVRSAAHRDRADVVIVDDVITTGATIDEAARVLRGAGFRVVGAVVLAATPLRSRFGDDTFETGSDIR